jgi:SAM-dependent methyltransferase
VKRSGQLVTLAAMADPEFEATRDFYDDFFEYLLNDRLRMNPRHAMVGRLIRRYVRRGDAVLDLGCGIGITTSLCARRGGEAVGVDLAPRLIEYARASVPEASFEVGDIASIDLAKRFDVVCLFDVVEHLPSDRWPTLWQNVVRHLSPRGRVLLTVPHPCATLETREQTPDALQIVDEIVYPDELFRSARTSSLLPSIVAAYGIDREREYYSAVLERAGAPTARAQRQRAPLFQSLIVRSQARKYWKIAQRVRGNR